MTNPTLQPSPASTQGSKSGCLWAIILAQAFFSLGLFVIVITLALLSISGRPSAFTHQGVDDNPRLNEIWASGAGDSKVIHIPLHGLIMLEDDDGFFDGQSSTAFALTSIKCAIADPDVRAIIMDIDSGGGGITASDILYKALMDFKKSGEGRKVVAIFRDTAASGAYYVALSADVIVAHPTSITGSIGVMIQTFNIKGLAEKIGVRDVTFKSGINKDLLNPFDDVSPEQRSMFQDIINELHSRFISLVATGRNLPQDKVKDLADGRIFTATTAERLGLIDKIGYWDDAVDTTSAILGDAELKIYRYEQKLSFSDLFRASQNVDIRAWLQKQVAGPRLMYLLRAP
jgi:protease IV